MLPCASPGRKVRLGCPRRPPCSTHSNHRSMDGGDLLVGVRRELFEAALHYYSDLSRSADIIPAASLRFAGVPGHNEPQLDALHGQDFILVLPLAASLPGDEDSKLGTSERIPCQSHRRIDSRGCFLSIYRVAFPSLERTPLGSD